MTMIDRDIIWQTIHATAVPYQSTHQLVAPMIFDCDKHKSTRINRFDYQVSQIKNHLSVCPIYYDHNICNKLTTYDIKYLVYDYLVDVNEPLRNEKLMYDYYHRIKCYK
jgi:hypothetical protein